MNFVLCLGDESKVKAPNMFERAKEEFEAVIGAIHQQKGSRFVFFFCDTSSSFSMKKENSNIFDCAMLMLGSVSVYMSLLMCYKFCFRNESDRMEFKSEKPGSFFFSNPCIKSF